MPENVAINPTTGEIRVLSAAGQWEPAQRARNPQTGAELYHDGASWQPVPKPRPADTMGRRFGLGVRDVVEGTTALPGLVYDAAALPFNLAGANIPPARDIVSGWLDRKGLPRAETTEERMISAPSQAVAGLIPTMGLGAALPAGSAAAEMLLGAPLSQIVGSATGGLGAQTTAEMGGGPLLQTAAGLVGGVAGAGAVPAARALGAAGPAMIQPFRQAGRERMAADVLLRQSDDPATLRARIDAGVADETRRLPGSTPTTAQAARDAGLSVFEQGARATADGASAIRQAEAARNQNRWNTITGLQGETTPEQRGQVVRGILAANERATGDAVSGFYRAIDPDGTARFPIATVTRAAEAAAARFDQAAMGGGVPTKLQGVLDDLAVANGAKDWKEFVEAGATANGAVNWRSMQNLSSRLGSIADEAGRAGDNRLAGAARMIRGSLDTAEAEAVRSGSFQPWQRELWEAAAKARRDMGQTFERAESGANASGAILKEAGYGMPALLDERVAGRALQSPADLRQVLGASGAAMPIVRQSLQEEFMARFLRASQTTADMAAGGTATPILSPAQAQKFMRDNAQVAGLLFGPAQRNLLNRLMADFGETSMVTATGRARGSDTAQNISVGNAISRVTNGLVDPNSPLAQTMFGIGGALRIVYSAPEAATRELLTRAAVDPRFASMLLAKATPQNVQRAAAYVDQNFADRLGTIASQAAGRATLRGVTAEAAAEAP